jgi:hypothetical protein
MKRQYLLLLATAMLLGFSCTPGIDLEKEKAAIKAVIEEETDAFYARDLDRMNAVYPDDGDATHINVNDWGYNISTNWDGGSGFTEFFTNNPDPEENNEKKTNWRIRVYPGAAWASYDNENYNEDGELINSSKHDQFLEKQDGEWKIVYMSILRTTGFDNAEKNEEVSRLYHELKPENVENILADDFVGHFNASSTWSKENHFAFISSTTVKDTISGQIAEGNWVATSFHRTGILDGKEVQGDMMQFKRYENGKIAEIFEYTDPGQWED